MASSAAIRSPSPALDALGNEMRRAIVDLLATGPLPVVDIARQLPISRPAVSKHLRILEEAQLIAHDRRGTQHVYRIESLGFTEARAWMDRFWDDAMSRFKLVAENTLPRRPRG